MTKKLKVKLSEVKIESFCTSLEKRNLKQMAGARTDQTWCTFGWCPTEDGGPFCTGDTCDICPA